MSRGRAERSVKYSNKIDSESSTLCRYFQIDRCQWAVYSLGITFFEMFHPPFKTGMERIHVSHVEETALNSTLIKSNHRSCAV